MAWFLSMIPVVAPGGLLVWMATIYVLRGGSKAGIPKV